MFFQFSDFNYHSSLINTLCSYLIKYFTYICPYFPNYLMCLDGVKINNQFHFNMDDLTFQLFHYMFYSITKNQTCSLMDTSCIHGTIAKKMDY
jgi:hypothetical protein